MAKKKPFLTTLYQLILPSLAVFTGVLLYSYRSPLELYPANDTFFQYSALSDGTYDSTKSQAELDTAGNHLHFRYSLDSKSESPFAMLLFHAHELARTIDLKKYNNIEIEVDPFNTTNFTVSLYMYIPGFSDPGLAETHRPYTVNCLVEGSTGHYKYPLKDLATPTWWFTAYETAEERLPKTDWRKLTHLTISEGIDTPLDTEVTISLTSLRFTDSLFKEIIRALIFTLLYVVGFHFVSEYLRKRKNRKIKESMYYNKNSRSSYDEAEAEKLITFLAERYSDPLLTLDKIKKEIGLNHFQVNEILKDHFKMHYKEYVNHIRIEEAKNLLANSNHQISIISEQVGYCYPNSFSRIFRQLEGKTPNQYRKEHQQE